MKVLVAVSSLTLALGLGASPVAAQDAGDLVRGALGSAAYEAAIPTLRKQAETDNAAQFGLGMLMVAATFEDLGQALVRHGAELPETGRLGAMLGFPVDGAPASIQEPEPLDYEAFRQILSDFISGLDAARAEFDAAGEGEDFTMHIDVMATRLDLDADGVADETESMGAVFGAMIGLDEASLVDTGSKTAIKRGETPGFVVGFDRADAYWLGGYTQILASPVDWLLAHDFEAFFEAFFHRLFPRADLPMQDHMGTGTLMMDAESDALIADAIATIHTLNFPVADRERLASVPERLRSITEHSRLNWQAILSETDDERELVPSPEQTSIIPGMTVTEETVSAWMDTLDTVDAILAGDLLVPHWRFSRGFDVSAYFETAQRTDVVLLLTGLDALDYLAEGPVADAEDFRSGLEIFGDDFPWFALWFN